MLNERQLQFRVGLFVLGALAAAGTMIVQFGNLTSFLESEYTVAIHFPTAPGISPATPVRMNGIQIGSVREVVLDQEHGGVLVVAAIREKYPLRTDSRARLVRSLLGDSSVVFTPGQSSQRLQPGSRVEGSPPVDPVKIVNRLEKDIRTTLDSFATTSRQWRQVAANLNRLMETNEGQFHVVMQRAAKALSRFTTTMETVNETFRHAGRIVGDPQHQKRLHETLETLPKLVQETRKTITTIRATVEKVDRSLSAVEELTGPLAERGQSIAINLDDTLSHMEAITSEIHDFTNLVNKKEGTLQKLVSDPALYQSLNRSAASLSVLMKNLQPVIQDLRIFSDKVARHPELLGVSGALEGSSGLKDPPPQQSDRPERQRRRR